MCLALPVDDLQLQRVCAEVLLLDEEMQPQTQ